jgi:RND family efflux transporter MFP subunit
MRIAAIGLLITIMGSGVWFIARGNDSAAATDYDPDDNAELVARRDLRATVLATGVVRPMVGAEVRVGSRVSGVLQRLYVTVGDRVRAGQLLAQLDSTELTARFRQAEAALANAGAEHEYAVVEYARAVELKEKAVITDAEMALMERQRDVTGSQVEQAKANVEAAEIQVGYTRIYAPINGVVAEVATQVGETVAASFAAPTFVTIIDLDRLEVWAYVDETDIGRVEVGQGAVFTVDTYTDTDFAGTVTAIRSMAEIQDAVVNYVTVIDIVERHGKILRPEMTTTVNIELEQRDDVLAIRNRAVRRDRNGTYALVVESGERVRRDIRIGYRDRDYSEVIEGLNEGERVVVGAVER